MDTTTRLWVTTGKAEPSRSFFCTALRLAVGHAFTAEYTRRFKEDFVRLDVTFEWAWKNAL